MNALRILRLDDRSGEPTVFQIVLEGKGRLVVREESSGAQALKTAHECRPDLILLEKGFDERRSSDVAAKLQKDPALRSVPIAFVTTATKASAGKASFPCNPASPSELLGFVDDLLNFNAVCVGC